MRYLAILFVTVALAGVATADISFEVNYLECEQDGMLDYLGVTIAGTHQANEIVVTTTTDWLSAQLLVIPDEEGELFQYPYEPYDASPASPTQNLIDNGIPPFVPPLTGLEYDCYVSDGTMGSTVTIAGGAVDLGGASVSTFDIDLLDIGWGNITSPEIGALRVAMVTLPKTATGTWSFQSTAFPANGPKTIVEHLPIIDGKLMPEPATMGLLAIGGLGLLIRRKR